MIFAKRIMVSIWTSPASGGPTGRRGGKESLINAGRVFHAAKPHVIGSGIGRALPARPRLEGGAILVGTQVRAAAIRRIETVGRPLRISHRLRPVGQRLVIVCPVPVGAPLPHISGHVTQAESVGGE